MKRIFIAVLCCAAFCSRNASAMLDTISFVSPLENVDDTTGWSAGDSLVSLNHSYNLLSGNATVSAYINLNDASLSHRLTRGLGVYSGELDEIDRVDVAGQASSIEHIDIVFTSQDYFVSSIEVRSLFDFDTTGANEEWAAIAFYNDNALLQTAYLKGSEDWANPLLDGDALWTGSVLADKLLFYVPTLSELQIVYPTYSFGDFNPALSEFAVARLEVTPIPAPGALLLGLIGLGAIRRFKLRRFV